VAQGQSPAPWMACQADVESGWVLWGQTDECTKIKQTDEEQQRRRIQQQCKWSENMSIRTWLLNPGLSKEQSNVTQTEETGQSLQLSTGHTVSLIHYITTVNSHIYTSTNWQLIHLYMIKKQQQNVILSKHIHSHKKRVIESDVINIVIAGSEKGRGGWG